MPTPKPLLDILIFIALLQLSFCEKLVLKTHINIIKHKPTLFLIGINIFFDVFVLGKICLPIRK